MKNIEYILMLSVFFLLFSCGNDNENEKEEVATEDAQELQYKALPEIVSISNEKLETINRWEKFRELSILMERFQRQNRGDLTYFAEEFVRLDNEMAKDSLFPQKFNKPSVKSRIVVLTTFTNQLKTRLDESAPIDSIDVSRKKVMDAYNALRLQLSESLKSKIYQEFLEKQEQQEK